MKYVLREAIRTEIRIRVINIWVNLIFLKGANSSFLSIILGRIIMFNLSSKVAISWLNLEAIEISTTKYELYAIPKIIRKVFAFNAEKNFPKILILYPSLMSLEMLFNPEAESFFIAIEMFWDAKINKKRISKEIGTEINEKPSLINKYSDKYWINTEINMILFERISKPHPIKIASFKLLINWSKIEKKTTPKKT